MVALAVRTIDQRPVTCNSRALLFRAHADLERGALIEAGCRLREAIRAYLFAECEYWGCVPKRKHADQASPSVLLAELRRCEHTTDWGFDRIAEAVTYCNRLAHCQNVAPEVIELSIEFVHMYLDQATYLVQPAAAGRLQ